MRWASLLGAGGLSPGGELLPFEPSVLVACSVCRCMKSAITIQKPIKSYSILHSQFQVIRRQNEHYELLSLSRFAFGLYLLGYQFRPLGACVII